MGHKVKSAIFENMEYCLYCGKPYPQIHHIFYGNANRKISDKHGFIAPLCMEHHTGNQGVHHNRVMDLALKRIAQRHFEQVGTREEFIKLIGKSYL